MRVVTGLLTYQFVLNASWGHTYFIRIFVIIKQDKNVLITLRSGFSTCPGIFGVASSVLPMKNIDSSFFLFAYVIMSKTILYKNVHINQYRCQNRRRAK